MLFRSELGRDVNPNLFASVPVLSATVTPDDISKCVRCDAISLIVSRQSPTDNVDVSYVNVTVSVMPLDVVPVSDTSPVIVGIWIPRNMGQTLRLVPFENVALFRLQVWGEPLVMDVMEIPSGNGSFAGLECRQRYMPLCMVGEPFVALTVNVPAGVILPVTYCVATFED